jgi:hypothetical protein
LCYGEIKFIDPGLKHPSLKASNPVLTNTTLHECAGMLETSNDLTFGIRCVMGKFIDSGIEIFHPAF